MTDYFEPEINKEAECCENPEISVSVLKWDKEVSVWHFDGLCHNCWAGCHGDIIAVDVRIEGENE